MHLWKQNGVWLVSFASWIFLEEHFCCCWQHSLASNAYRNKVLSLLVENVTDRGWDWGAFFWGQMTSFLLHTLIVQNHSFLVALSLHSIAFKEITILPWPSLKNYILYFRFSLKVLSNHLIHFAFSPKIFPHSSHWNLFLSIPRARSYSLPPPLVHTHPTFPKSLHPFSVYKDSQL